VLELGESSPLLINIQFRWLESSAISLSRSKQKALQGREFQCPAILSKPLALLNVIQLQRREWSVASRLPTRQKAPLRQKLHPPSILSEPLVLLIFKKTKTGSCKMELALL